MQSHEQYYLQSHEQALSPRLVQPFNKGTATAVLHGLLHIAQMDANAIVSIFPCDQYYDPESAFTAALECVWRLRHATRAP